MALPMANAPRYKLTIPSTGKSVTYRPFLIKEEKALLIAQQSEDPETMITTLKSVIESCIIDPIKPSDLAIFDIEYIFTQLRSKSVGEIVESKYRCNNDVGGQECGNIMEAKIDLTDIKPEWEEKIDPEIQLTDKIVVKLRYPKFSIKIGRAHV